MIIKREKVSNLKEHQLLQEFIDNIKEEEFFEIDYNKMIELNTETNIKETEEKKNKIIEELLNNEEEKINIKIRKNKYFNI